MIAEHRTKNILKEHLIFGVFFIAVLFIFAGDVIFLKSGLLTGDNIVQAFPWLNSYSMHLKEHTFPYWVNGIHCGFPLIGEGQVGGFYPFNVLFFYILPFKVAYNLTFIFHLLVAGFATYFLTRKLGSDVWGGAFAAVILCCGSAFANVGYHLSMMRSLAWFPVVLLFLEYYLSDRRKKYMFMASGVMAIQLLSGSVQMSAYSFLMYFLYLSYGAYLRKKNIVSSIKDFVLMLLIPVILFLPQLLLTVQVVRNSGRISSLDFALWGSLNPMSIFTTILPGIFSFKGQIFTEDLFIGSISLLFLTMAFSFAKREKILNPIKMVMITSLLLALGWFNPVYVLFIRLFKFYTFRGPSRFVFFSVFSASVMAGVGFSRFFIQEREVITRTMNRYLRAIFLGVVSIVILGSFLILGKPLVLGGGKWFVSKYIVGATYHRHDVSYYYDKIERIYAYMTNSLSLSNRNMMLSVIFLMIAVVFVVILKKYFTKQHTTKNYAVIKCAVLLLVISNLFFYKNFPGAYNENIREYSTIDPNKSTIYRKIKEDQSYFRIMPFDIRSGKLPFWSLPNTNMYFGISSIAAYSPLSGKDYRRTLMEFQLVDDSIGLLSPDKKAITSKNLEFLKAFNVKYIISHEKLSHQWLKELVFENGTYLYRLEGNLGVAFFSKSEKSGAMHYNNNINVVEYVSGYAEFEINTDSDVMLVFSEMYFPGWEAQIDNNNVTINKYKGLLQSIRCKKGKHNIKFSYKPLSSLL